MKTKLTIRMLMYTIIALASLACNRFESPQTPQKIPQKPADGEEDVKEEIRTRDVLSYCGVIYPSGYDWRSNPQYGNVACKLFFNVDGENIIEMNAGYGYEVSPDPESHHIVNENLYTDFSNDTETVVRKNGSLLFRYQGREMLLGVAVKEDVVYTLGQSRSGDGFSYRADGKVLLESAGGHVITSLLEDNGELYFGYEEDSDYFIWKAGESTKLESLGHTVCDMRISKGNIILLAENSNRFPVIIENGAVKALDVIDAFSSHDCHFLQDGDILLVTGYLDAWGKDGILQKKATIWTLPDTSAYVLTSEWGALSYFLKDGKFCYIAGRWYSLSYMKASWGDHDFMSRGMHVYPVSGCGAISNGELYAGISIRATGEACILSESGVIELGFNGCITRFGVSSRITNSSGR